jgi:hypothetical protein
MGQALRFYEPTGINDLTIAIEGQAFNHSRATWRLQPRHPSSWGVEGMHELPKFFVPLRKRTATPSPYSMPPVLSTKSGLLELAPLKNDKPSAMCRNKISREWFSKKK